MNNQGIESNNQANVVPNQGNTQFTNMTEGFSNMFANKNLLIGLLVILLILSFLGINILLILGNFIQSVLGIFGPLISEILSVFGYTTGSIINKTADVVADTAKLGIDVAEGSVQSVGNLLRNASDQNVDLKARIKLDNALNNPTSVFDNAVNNPAEIANTNYTTPIADETSSAIQAPIASSKTSWCLVGEYKNRRGCIEISDHDKCISGQIYPSQQDCLNLHSSNNVPFSQPQIPLPPVYIPNQNVPPNMNIPQLFNDGQPISNGPPNYIYRYASQ